MTRVSIELISPYRILLGVFFQKGSEYVNDEKLNFSEVSLGAIFIFLRICKYSKVEEQ